MASSSKSRRGEVVRLSRDECVVLKRALEGFARSTVSQARMPRLDAGVVDDLIGRVQWCGESFVVSRSDVDWMMTSLCCVVPVYGPSELILPSPMLGPSSWVGAQVALSSVADDGDVLIETFGELTHEGGLSYASRVGQDKSVLLWDRSRFEWHEYPGVMRSRRDGAYRDLTAGDVVEFVARSGETIRAVVGGTRDDWWFVFGDQVVYGGRYGYEFAWLTGESVEAPIDARGDTPSVGSLYEFERVVCALMGVPWASVWDECCDLISGADCERDALMACTTW